MKILLSAAVALVVIPLEWWVCKVLWNAAGDLIGWGPITLAQSGAALGLIAGVSRTVSAALESK